MLDQGSKGGRDHFAIMNLMLAMGLITAHLVRAPGDGRGRDSDAFLLQAILHGPVVGVGNRPVRSLHPRLFLQQLARNRRLAFCG